MLFNSFAFLIFFIIVVPIYFIIPQKIRWVHLLVSSYIFYMAWNPIFIILIIFSTFVNYTISWLIYNEFDNSRRKKFLLLALFINFSLLFLFKYSMFANEIFLNIYGKIASFFYIVQGNTKEVSLVLAESLINNFPTRNYSILLPMGISFYTFQAIAYVIDVYRKEIEPTKHYGIFSLYITFFPQLVAGPIERYTNLMPQFFEKHNFDKERVLYGIKIMMYGFFKKIVIADRIAIAVNTVYSYPSSYNGLHMFIVMIMFSIQIYCDFSGYSDIALGTAKVLGFNLSVNFKNPFFSKSITELWRRWHITLNAWFVDYVYIPLGGSRKGNLRHYSNLLIVFLLSGVWHGANWTYIIWGSIQGVLVILENIFVKKNRKNSNKFVNFIKILATFLIFSYSFIFFRASNISDAIYISTNVFRWFTLDLQFIYETITSLGLTLKEIQILVYSIGFLAVCELFSDTNQVYEQVEKLAYPLRLVFYVLIGSFILTSGVFYATGDFIYFQF